MYLNFSMSHRIYTNLSHMYSFFTGSKERCQQESEDIEIDESYTFKPFVFEIIEPDGVTPNPRSGHRIACDEDNFYSYGGYNPLNVDPGSAEAGEDDVASLFRELWKFNYASMSWKKLEVRDIPFALASNALILSGKVLMVYGGTGVPFHLERSNDLYICNLAEKDLKFRKVETTGQAPPALYGQAVFMKNGYFYVIGGTTGYEYFTDIHRLNLLTSVWEEVYISKGMKNEPPGRYRHELAVVGNKVFVLGGGIGSAAYEFEEIPVFDLDYNVWDVVRTIKDDIHGYPLPRQYHSAVKIPGTESFVMVGGVFLGGRILDDAWRLDISSLSWRKISSLRLCTPVYFHATSVTPSGKIYTFGGVSKTVVAQTRVSQVQSAWICIPKLKDISWEAVMHYGLVEDLSPGQFKQLGLPSEYYNKLT